MNYNPKIHNRRSIRLKGHDYSRKGLYFITICCYRRMCHFGQIKKGQIHLNNAGKIANQCWVAIPEHFPFVALHEYVVMPNHVHGIIEFTTGANQYSPKSIINSDSWVKSNSPLPRSPSNTVGSAVRGFKIGVTKWMRQNTEIYNVWQRNYYDHIIRNKQSYHCISTYIKNNPANWKEDKFHRER